ncbi:VWA domain-containing protein [Streptomyces californicus]|uniref:VWA domain-containing protein n=1 Tax=Streptomyces californicus TaxID=67351 RepID=UPI0004C0BFF8|nr:VWA domain-containing protein [Streptomyces californicus]
MTTDPGAHPATTDPTGEPMDHPTTTNHPTATSHPAAAGRPATTSRPTTALHQAAAHHPTATSHPTTVKHPTTAPEAQAPAPAHATEPPPTPGVPDDERLRRWRMVLGADSAEGTGCTPTGQDAAMDGALTALYGGDSGGRRPGGRGSGGRAAGLGASAPAVARWLGDIRTYFPASVVQVMQRDAIDRLGLSALLLEPEMLEAVEPDVHLVGTLLSLGKAMPETTKETARAVVRKVVADLEKRLESRTRATLSGALDRSARTSRPRHHDIDWDRTVRANLKHYLTVPGRDGGEPTGTIVPERLIGHGRAARSAKKEVVLCVDQSGSMAASVVYASVFGAVLASLRTLSTRLVVFDTAVVDLTDQLADPVDVLFGTQLGGGTDINRALAYCQSRITRPADTVVVLISDLYEGGIRDEMLKRVAAMKAAGVEFVTLLALSDEGAPAYDRDHAAALGALGAPAFACTPDLFPDVMAAAIEKRPLPVPDPEPRP